MNPGTAQAAAVIGEQPPRRRWGARHGLRPRVPRNEWLLPAGPVISPAWDYSQGVFAGRTPDGTPWSAPFTPDLLPHITSLVNGWCTEKQGSRLYELASQQVAEGGQFIEVGTARGLSAVWAGWASKAAGGPRLLCVDLFDGSPYDSSDAWSGEQVLEDWKRNITYAGLRDVCQPLRADSAQAGHDYQGPPVTFLYIDGLHTYQGCKGDYLAWQPHLARGAVVAFDDCDRTYPGIMRFMRELAAAPDCELLGRADFMLYWRYNGGPR